MKRLGEMKFVKELEYDGMKIYYVYVFDME